MMEITEEFIQKENELIVEAYLVGHTNAIKIILDSIEEYKKENKNKDVTQVLTELEENLKNLSNELSPENKLQELLNELWVKNV